MLWTGEFGRLPISQGTDGRDHNRHGFSLWLAGGGFKPGYVHGATDEFGYKSVDDVVTVHDLQATLLHALGLDHRKLTYPHEGRLDSLTDAEVTKAKVVPQRLTGVNACTSWRTSASGRLWIVGTFVIGLTDHLEGPRDQPSAAIFDEVADLVRLADQLGVQYAWFSEHHAHAHYGHLPTPLLFALHLAGQTQNIRLGTAIICLNLHHPLDVAEQVAVADVLTKGRMAVGFGSGSTPEEFGLFGLAGNR